MRDIPPQLGDLEAQPPPRQMSGDDNNSEDLLGFEYHAGYNLASLIDSSNQQGDSWTWSVVGDIQEG